MRPIVKNADRRGAVGHKRGKGVHYDTENSESNSFIGFFLFLKTVCAVHENRVKI